MSETENSIAEEMTNEELLRKVIEAQVKGGFKKHGGVDDELEVGDFRFAGCYVVDDRNSRYAHILAILLDTEGCKAAYNSDDSIFVTDFECTGELCGFPKYAVPHAIIAAWNSGDGNNLRAALEAAVKLLPKDSND